MYVIATIMLVVALATIVEAVRATKSGNPSSALVFAILHWLVSIILAVLVIWEYVT